MSKTDEEIDREIKELNLELIKENLRITKKNEALFDLEHNLRLENIRLERVSFLAIIEKSKNK